MSPQSGPGSSLLISYLALRKAIGLIGIALPFVLAIGKMFHQPGLQPSISAYYYTNMGDVFVGSLCAIGIFMMTYRGYDSGDNVAGWFACVFAVGVAVFPTSPQGQTTVVGIIHLVCAVCFFLTLAYFSLCLFRRTDPNKTPTRRKLQRNVVYMACGLIIVGSILLIAILAALSVTEHHPRFWLESLAVFAFGVSWLVKGEAILKDQ